MNICVAAKERSKLKPKFLSKLMEAAHAGELAPTADRITVSKMCRRWLELRHPTIKDDTAKEYARMIAADIDPAIGKIPLAKVRQSDLQEFVNAPMAAGHGRTAEKRHQLLRSVLDLAVGDGILDRSPMRLVRPPVYDTETGKALTPAEEKELLRLLDGQSRVSRPCMTRCSFCSIRECGGASLPASASRTAFSRSAAGRSAKANGNGCGSYPSRPCWPPCCPRSTSKVSAPCARMRSLRRCTVSCRSTICTISGTPTSRAARSAMCRAKLFPPGRAMRRTAR